MPCMRAEFRPRGPFSVFGTEVSCLACVQTSVPEAHFPCLGRKFYALHTCRLPYQRLFFRVWDGSFLPCMRPDFRPRGSFSVFGTEVLCLACVPTSVPKGLFPRLGRKFYDPRMFCKYLAVLDAGSNPHIILQTTKAGRVGPYLLSDVPCFVFAFT